MHTSGGDNLKSAIYAHFGPLYSVSLTLTLARVMVYHRLSLLTYQISFKSEKLFVDRWT